MQTTITLDEAQSHLREVIAQLATGDEIAVTDGNQVVARILGSRPLRRPRPGPGLCKGMITIVSDDEDHLRDFAEYMP
jgi:antitoxin (DNA-binding transcriptional repressor) of toxin-antitoxin stability system